MPVVSGSARLVMDMSRTMYVSVSMMRMPASVPAAVVRVMVIAVPVIPAPASIVPRVVESAVIPWVIPASHIERVIPAVISPWCVRPCVPVPWIIVTAPVPRASHAVWRVVEVDVVVKGIWVVGHGHDSAPGLTVILYLGRLVVGQHYGVLPVSEQVYF